MSVETAQAREEVMKCEQEIHSIKAALRRVGTVSSTSSSDGDNTNEQNSMEIVLLKVNTTNKQSYCCNVFCIICEEIHDVRLMHKINQ
jgi:copper chaperone CopZ